MPHDVNLDTLKVLLLYAQWMSCSEDESRSGKLKGRYNDISLWAILGLAGRYALLMGLDRNAVAPFQTQATVTEEQISRYRVWLNLLTCDCLLMLTSGLPSSLDPIPGASVARRFCSQKSQMPGDARIAGLLELAAIAYRLGHKFEGTATQEESLAIANQKMVEWER